MRGKKAPAWVCKPALAYDVCVKIAVALELIRESADIELQSVRLHLRLLAAVKQIVSRGHYHRLTFVSTLPHCTVSLTFSGTVGGGRMELRGCRQFLPVVCLCVFYNKQTERGLYFFLITLFLQAKSTVVFHVALNFTPDLLDVKRSL